MTIGSSANLVTPHFLKDVLTKEAIPLNPHTDTDFILSGGITIAIRKSADYVLLKVDRVPDHANFIVNNPTRELMAERGETFIKRLFQLALIAVEKDRARIVRDVEPDRELIGVIQDAMLYFAPPTPPGIDRRAVVLAPSSIQHGSLALDTSRTSEQNEALLDALRPLLAEIPEGGLGFEKFSSAKHFHSNLRNGVDYIFTTDVFTGIGGFPEGISPVESMKFLSGLHDRINALGFDPNPIIEAITA